MKQNFALTLSLIGGLMLLASACVKEKTDDEKLRPVGSEIIFSAATSYDNQGGTRTVYTGETYTYGTSEYERIDWESDDRVSIVYGNKASTQTQYTTTQAEYKVTNVLTSTNENDLADVEATGTKLVWGGASDHIFYAMYPTSTSGWSHSNSNASINTSGKVQGIIPATQNLVEPSVTQDHTKYLPDMKYAYMVGYANSSNISGNRVTIPFTPAVTAFNFVFKAAAAVTVTKFELTSNSNGTPLTGSFNFTITGGKERNGRIVGANWETVNSTSTGKKITVSFGDSGKTLAANEYLDFTVFTLPIDQTGLTITFTCKSTNNSGAYTYQKTLDLKDDADTWHTFAAGKKHVVTNDQLKGEKVTYYFSLSQATLSFVASGAASSTGSNTEVVTSYKKVGTTNVPVAWSVDAYSTDGGNNWTSELPVYYLSTFTYNNNAPTTTTKEFNAKMAAAPRSGLGSKQPLSTSSSAPWDLSTTSTTHGGTSMNTANCYVVSAPGYYCFPLVYGNAIKGGSTFTKAFYNNTTGTKFLKRFYDHSDSGIQKAYIDEAYPGVDNATIVWQDKSGLVSNIALFDVTVGSTTHKYIRFQVPPQNMVPGNAIIAVRDANNTILWSWHIWVTDQNMAAVTIQGTEFMRVNLGWCDGGTYTQPARTLKVRLKQAESGNTVIITLNQSAGSDVTLNDTNPHYQWGRKDPLIPPLSLNSNEPNTDYSNSMKSVSYGTEIPQFSRSGSSETTTIGTAIQTPTKMYRNFDTDGDSRSDWLTTSYCNLWNYTQTKPTYYTSSSGSHYTQSNGFKHGKTVYDPCPYGYTVPNIFDFAKMHKGSDGYAPVNSSFSPSWSSGRLKTGSYYWYAMGKRLYKKYVNSGEGDPQFYYLNKQAHYHISGSTGGNQSGNAENCLYFYFNNTVTTPAPQILQSTKTEGRSVRCVKDDSQ